MDDIDHEEEFEATRKARVKELEAMVLQLERENKKLLYKVTESAEKYREEASSSAGREKGSAGEKLLHAASVEDLISLDGHLDRVNEDEWLFVSPAKPPTPSQRQVTPSQWLARGGTAEEEESLFSLDDVRKDLSFQISNAENMSPSTRRRAKGGTGNVSPLTSRVQPSNSTAKRYLEQVRVRRTTPSPTEVEPPTRQPARPDHRHSNMDTGSEDTVPVVRWRRPVVPQDTPQSPTAEEAVPKVHWKKPVMPHNDESQRTEDVPVVRWKKPVVPKEATRTEESVPVVRWKKPVLPQDAPPTSTGSEESIPVVRWKKPVVPPQEDEHPASEEEAVPVVRWKRPVLPKDEDYSEDVLAVSKNPSRHKNVPAKAITVTARSPPEGDEEMEYRSNTLPRSVRHSSGGLRPPGSGSPQYRPRNASAERPSQRYAGASLRERSPSPTGPPRQLGRAGSHSPSRAVHHSPSSSPKSQRRQSPHTLHPSPNKQSLVKTPSAPSPRKAVLPSPSSGGSPRGRTIPSTASAPAGQNRLSSPGRRQLPTPPSQRQQPTATSPVRPIDSHPRTNHSPQRAPRGGLTEPPSPRSALVSQIKPARHSATPPSSSRQKQAHHKQDDNWLEGCF